MLPELRNKKVVVLGMGLTGQSCARFLSAHGAIVTAMDKRETLQLDLPVPVIGGEINPRLLCEADLILLSPGISLKLPALQCAFDAGIEVIGDIELFARFNQKPVIAITGSNGKSTVTMLVDAMLQAAGKKVAVGGNIGTPALELLDQDYDVAVLELSSFQLETTHNLAPIAATILNVSEDHLDRYEDLASYQQAKLSIYRQAEYTVCNRDDKLTWPIVGKPDILFGLALGNSTDQNGFSYDSKSGCIMLAQQVLMHSKDCALVGQHNMINIQAAAALAMQAGADLSAVVKGASNFTGLPHRCQTVSHYNNVLWINDSKATNVGATIAALQGLQHAHNGKLILIAGGDGKGADFAPLQPWLDDAVDVLITLGKDGARINALKANLTAVSSLVEAVQVAAGIATAGDMVLLSPACASLDMFSGYAQRGQCFADAVKELAA